MFLRSFFFFSIVILLAFKGEEALAEVIECDEQAHSAQHRNVLLNGCRGAGQQRAHERLGGTVGDQIAGRNVQHKAPHDLPVALFILESEVFIQKIAQNTAEKVVRRGAQPIAQPKHVIKHEHYRRAEERIYNADYDKAQKRLIKKF